MSRRPLRIAHAYGNRRTRIERAIAASVDMIEVDIRFDRGRVWVRHELRFSRLPLLYNVGIKGIHRQGPWAASLGRFFLRLDIAPLPFEEVIQTCSGKAGLLIDLKTDYYSLGTAGKLVERVLHHLESKQFIGAVAFCGNWRLLSLVKEQRPGADVWYSIDSERDWRIIAPRLGMSSTSGNQTDGVAAITIQRDLLTTERSALLRERGIRVYAWDIDNEDEARRALDLGASGIIADDLELLSDLGEVVHRAEAS